MIIYMQLNTYAMIDRLFDYMYDDCSFVDRWAQADCEMGSQSHMPTSFS